MRKPKMPGTSRLTVSCGGEDGTGASSATGLKTRAPGQSPSDSRVYVSGTADCSWTTGPKEKKTAKTGKKKSARKPSAAFMKPMTPSPALSEVIGSKPVPRTEVTKKLWAYIKRKGLQDKKNRRNINADANLKAVFGGKATVNMFEMTKLVNKHLK